MFLSGEGVKRINNNMPTYTFVDTKTEEEWSEFMSISSMEEFLEKNPHIKQVISTCRIGDPFHLGILKTDGKFREHIKRIKKHNRGSTINTGNLSEI